MPAVRDALAERVARERLDNVSVRLGVPADPKLPDASFDRIFMVHMYHEIEQPYEFLWRMRPSLRPEGLVVVVDEAYFEFSGETVAGLVSEHENLVVLRTMSKWAGLAGLRVGYGLMSPKLVQHIIDIKSPYNVNVAAEAALIASLEDADVLLERVRGIVTERERMFGLLQDISGVKPWPSSGNFILCSFKGRKAEAVYE